MIRIPKTYTTLPSELKPISHAVYATTACDEVLFRTPDALMNGEAIRLHLKNCCPDIDFNSLLYCDIQFLLGSIKLASMGSTLDIEIICPKCRESRPYDLNLQAAIGGLSVKKWFQTIYIENMVIVFQSPTYKEMIENQTENFRINKQLYQISLMMHPEDFLDMSSELLQKQKELQLDFQSRCIKSVSTLNGKISVTERKFIKEWLEQCDISIQKRISLQLDEAQKESSIPTLSSECNECKYKFPTPIDLDFCQNFRQKLIPMQEDQIVEMFKVMEKNINKITDDLLRTVWFMRGGISYEDAFQLTYEERKQIGKIIEESTEFTRKTGLPMG
ncbi:Uncharacterised protein [uncultured archaeon]|nr:Uncharacterised protein [uncultured archaeon]